jgi:FtsH-binding integral membrane protein
LNPFDNDRQTRPTFGIGDYSRPQVGVAASNAFLSQVFSWMFAGLLITGLVGWYIANSTAGRAIMGSGIFLFLMFAQLGMVFYLSARIEKIEPGTATGLFLGYCALSGVTFSVFFAAYTMASMMNVFVMTGALFGVLALFGKTTTMDLRRVGTIAFAALIAIIVAMLVNAFFIHSTALTNVISVLGIIVFAGLTAWDMQRLTQYGTTSYGQDAAMDTRMAVIGALGLYLNFINMFIMLLRLFGDRR